MSGGSDIEPHAPAAAEAEKRPRLDWVDALKGIGIIAVVAGHVWTRGPVRDAIYAVHMPLFFILSGYTARHVPWRDFLPRLSRSLLVPFASFSLLLLAADVLIEGLRGHRPIFGSALEGVTTILFATEQTRGPFTILWFVPALFLARLCWNGLAKPGRNPDDRFILLAMGGVFALALVAQYLVHASPFGLLAVPGALLLIWSGSLWRLWVRPQPLAVLILVALTVATLIWFPPINMKQGDLGWPALSLIGALAATMTLASAVQHLPGAALRPLISLGRASLVIMYVHVAIIHYLALYAPKPALFPIALGTAWSIDWLVRRSYPTRLLLLGEAKAARRAIDSSRTNPQPSQ